MRIFPPGQADWPTATTHPVMCPPLLPPLTQPPSLPQTFENFSYFPRISQSSQSSPAASASSHSLCPSLLLCLSASGLPGCCQRPLCPSQQPASSKQPASARGLSPPNNWKPQHNKVSTTLSSSWMQQKVRRAAKKTAELKTLAAEAWLQQGGGIIASLHHSRPQSRNTGIYKVSIKRHIAQCSHVHVPPMQNGASRELMNGSPLVHCNITLGSKYKDKISNIQRVWFPMSIMLPIGGKWVTFPIISRWRSDVANWQEIWLAVPACLF